MRGAFVDEYGGGYVQLSRAFGLGDFLWQGGVREELSFGSVNSSHRLGFALQFCRTVAFLPTKYEGCVGPCRGCWTPGKQH
ncbi:hypothetical protein R1flu_017495 [Riccia fluitans]|uniref:Uncharacterized protein n=1 Tax=Riccia fluitans TaxID=41844 RepID=A0ABD1ZD45_9MARC